jgi:two-component system OmpR family response regulator
MTEFVKHRILVVDDDAEIRKLVAQSLERRGYDVIKASNVVEAEAALAAHPIDLIILDVMMPGEDGLSFCRRAAKTDGPFIIILSALDASTDRVAGLEIGADSYIPKPCDPQELVATVRALLRRSRAALDDGSTPARTAEFDEWRLDFIGRVLRRPDGVVVDLAASEFALLKAFVEAPRRTLSRDRLLELAYGDPAEVFDRAIDVQVSRLRRKFGKEGARLIATVRNEGYVFTPSVVRR